MEKQRNFNQRGITLVALVITIIILLILAGITISQLTGSGLFENAKLAEEKSKNAQEKEDSILADYENKIGEYIYSSREQITADMVSFTPTDITWKAKDGTDITSVKQALDYLYSD